MDAEKGNQVDQSQNSPQVKLTKRQRRNRKKRQRLKNTKQKVTNVNEDKSLDSGMMSDSQNIISSFLKRDTNKDSISNEAHRSEENQMSEVDMAKISKANSAQMSKLDQRMIHSMRQTETNATEASKVDETQMGDCELNKEQTNNIDKAQISVENQDIMINDMGTEDSEANSAQASAEVEMNEANSAQGSKLDQQMIAGVDNVIHSTRETETNATEASKVDETQMGDCELNKEQTNNIDKTGTEEIEANSAQVCELHQETTVDMEKETNVNEDQTNKVDTSQGSELDMAETREANSEQRIESDQEMIAEVENATHSTRKRKRSQRRRGKRVHEPINFSSLSRLECSTQSHGETMMEENYSVHDDDEILENEFYPFFLHDKLSSKFVQCGRTQDRFGNLFDKTPNELNTVPLKNVVHFSFDSPEVVEAAHSECLQLAFWKYQHLSHEMISEIELFFDHFFDTDLQMVKSLRNKEDVRAIIIGHFVEGATPELFSVLLFKLPPDNIALNTPTVLLYLATLKQYQGHQFAVHLLACLQSYLKAKHPNSQLFCSAPIVQTQWYLNLGFEDFDSQCDDSEVRDYIHSICVTMNYTDADGNQWNDGVREDNLRFFILAHDVRDSVFSLSLTSKRYSSGIFFQPVRTSSYMMKCSKTTLYEVIRFMCKIKCSPSISSREIEKNKKDAMSCMTQNADVYGSWLKSSLSIPPRKPLDCFRTYRKSIAICAGISFNDLIFYWSTALSSIQIKENVIGGFCSWM